MNTIDDGDEVDADENEDEDADVRVDGEKWMRTLHETRMTWGELRLLIKSSILCNFECLVKWRGVRNPAHIMIIVIVIISAAPSESSSILHWSLHPQSCVCVCEWFYVAVCVFYTKKIHIEIKTTEQFFFSFSSFFHRNWTNLIGFHFV